jgi:hypothetical protein
MNRCNWQIVIECNLAWIFPTKHSDSTKKVGLSGFNWAEEFTVCARCPPERYDVPGGLVEKLLKESVEKWRRQEKEEQEEHVKEEGPKETVQKEEDKKENHNPNALPTKSRPHSNHMTVKPGRKE